LAFYGTANYNANPSAFNSAVQICTPITSDSLGNVYFGFIANNAPLAGLASGLARISSSGAGTWVNAASLVSGIQKPTFNCAPALSVDGTTVYIGLNNHATGNSGFSNGYLVALDSVTLVLRSSAQLTDVASPTSLANISDDGTASPTVGPDGDVFYGVLEANFPANHARGWMLHFDRTLSWKKPAGAFGWDDTASIVPASIVSSYTGSSEYLVLTKYNNYADPGAGGGGQNKLAVLDPNATQTNPISGATVMKEVLTVLGPTPNTALPGVREWCINTVAIDQVNKCAVVNSEDGKLYRWDFTTNALTSSVSLNGPVGEAYTPTVIGPDGAVYAINNAQLYSCVTNPPHHGTPGLVPPGMTPPSVFKLRFRYGRNPG
jgi:hypothetical protein